MDFRKLELDEDQLRFRDEVRAFVAEHVTEEVHEDERRTGGSFDEKLHLAMASKGWVMPGLAGARRRRAGSRPGAHPGAGAGPLAGPPDHPGHDPAGGALRREAR